MPQKPKTARTELEILRLGVQTAAERDKLLVQGVEIDCAPRDLEWDKDETPPWHPLEGEPSEWYTRFERFFLMRGPARSVQSAYRLWVTSEGREVGTKGMKDVTNVWTEMSRRYSWKARAFAYDGEINRRIMLQVEEASRRLRNAAPQAVDALVAALASPRLQVAAAKEILDRAGLPAVTRQEIRTHMSFTTEDMEEAHAEVAEWEKHLLDESG